MATEGSWEVVSSSNGIAIPNTPPFEIYGDVAVNQLDGDVRETRYVQIGSYLLYTMKEQLKAAGWEVIASCYRDNVGPKNYYETIGGEDVGGFWSGDTLGNNKTKDYDVFKVIKGDGWVPQSGSIPGTEFNDKLNPAYSVIYPGYVKVKEDVDNVSPNRKGLLSDSLGVRTAANIAGRSWILLKAPDEFKEENAIGSSTNYHIVLDYTHNSIPRFMTTGVNFPKFIYTPGTSYYEEATYNKNSQPDNFGSFINIIVLPDYQPTYEPDGTPIAGAIWDRLTNVNPVNANDEYILSTHTIDTLTTNPGFLRPSHANEISYSPRESTTGLGGKFMRFIGNTADKYFVNLIHTTQGSLVDKSGLIILGSANGQPMFHFAMNSIADPLNKGILQANTDSNTYSGTKYFFFWSNLERATSAVDLTTGQANKKYLANTTYLNSLSSTIFDSTEENACMFYYNKYSPGLPVGATKYSSRVIATCAPVIYTQANTTKRAPQILLSTTPLAKATSDYTYMEWPLPLISIQGATRNFNYVGRMMDIKLGPAAAPSGIVAQEEGNPTLNYDRILFGGLWLPYSGDGVLTF